MENEKNEFQIAPADRELFRQLVVAFSQAIVPYQTATQVADNATSKAFVVLSKIKEIEARNELL